MNTAAREELRTLIAKKMRDKLTMGDTAAGQIADAVMDLFYDVDDDWDHVDTRTYIDVGNHGDRWLDQRSIVAKVGRDSVEHVREPDRGVR